MDKYLLPVLAIVVLTTLNIGISSGQTIIEAFPDEPASGVLNCTQKHHKHGHINTCSLGERVKFDRIVERLRENHSSKQGINLTVDVVYPRSGQAGFLLTYVELKINEDSKSTARFEVVSGGIGQHDVTFRLAGDTCTFLNYNASFYGL